MLMQIRRLHAYIGTFIAPSVIYFAATGLLQIYSLHEAHGSYTPPKIIEELSGIHKDQRFGAGHRDADDGDASHPGAAPDAHPDHAPQGHEDRGSHPPTTLLKLFFSAVAIGLIFSTSFGIWMALQQGTKRRAHLVLLAIGVLAPAILAALTV